MNSCKMSPNLLPWVTGGFGEQVSLPVWTPKADCQHGSDGLSLTSHSDLTTASSDAKACPCRLASCRATTVRLLLSPLEWAFEGDLRTLS